MSAARTFRVLPGFNLTLGYTLAYLSLIILVPLAAVFLKTASLSFEQFWAIVTAARVVASYKLSFGASLAGGGDQCRLRADAGLGAGALFVSRQEADRCAGRPALRAADGGRRDCADRALCPERLARAISRAARHQGCLHAARRAGCAGLHRPAVRRAHRAAGPRRSRHRTGGSCGQSRRPALADLPPCDPADPLARAAHRLRARLRAGGRRIRLGHLHRRQPARWFRKSPR